MASSSLDKPSAPSAVPSVPQPLGGAPQESTNDILLDFGQQPQIQPQNPIPTINQTTTNDLFSDFAPPTSVPKAPTSAKTSNIDSLLDISGSADLINPIKSSSSTDNFKTQNDPFGDLLGSVPKAATPTMPTPTPKSTADDLVSKMLNDLDVKPKNGNAPKMTSGLGSPRPNYNVSFHNGQTPSANSQNSNSTAKPKVSSNTFEDLLGPSFNINPGSSNSNGNKTIGEMKKQETMKTMTAEEARVFAWKEGKSRNLRALLCSLHTVIWPDSRWKTCGMHQLVNENDVGKMYKKACLAVHPDKQMGTENEELSKLIFIELNDAWAEFNKDQ